MPTLVLVVVTVGIESEPGGSVSDDPTKLLLGISGFLETERRESGVENILWSVFSDVEHCASARFMWNDSLVTMVRLIRRLKTRWPEIELNILGYSYGGHTAVNLAAKLWPWMVTNLFLIDPVWRWSNHMPSVFSVYGIGTLVVPKNVKTCTLWRQKQSAIRGCKVLMQSADTGFTEDLLSHSHVKIDNSPAIQAKVIERMKA